MGLKKKKFVIQWRKFESNCPFKLKVMNFLSFHYFLEFILICQDFLKAEKGVYLAWDPCSANVQTQTRDSAN